MYDESNAKVVRLVVRDLAVRIGSRDVMVELTKSHYTKYMYQFSNVVSPDESEGILLNSMKVRGVSRILIIIY